MATSGDVDTSKVDFYEFLGLEKLGSAASVKEITRAGRQTSFRYHPDKVEATPENLEKFHIAQIAVSVLTDPEQKTKYDQQRDAKLRRKAEVEALDERRRKMAKDLEDRERNGSSENVVAGQKRTFSERDMKIRAAQEANRRKIEEKNAQIRLQAERNAAEARAQSTKDSSANGTNKADEPASLDQASAPRQNGNDEEDSMVRSIRLRWAREGEGKGYDEAFITETFPEGSIENVVLLKDKKRKIEGKGKTLMGTAVVIFASKMAASTAMSQKGQLADTFETVEWMSGGKDE